MDMALSGKLPLKGYEDLVTITTGASIRGIGKERVDWKVGFQFDLNI